MKALIYISMLGFILHSCKKAEDRSCLKSTGEITVREVAVGNFNELFLGTRLNYTLVSDSINFLKIKGGKNLVNSIDFKIVNQILYIENQNRCNFLRDLGEIMEVEIHYTQLVNVSGKMSHNLVTLDTIRGEYFNYYNAGASGNAKLLVNTNLLNGFANDGNSDYSFAGKTRFAHIQAHSNGFADVRNLEVLEKLEITSRSNRAVYCHADGIPLIVNLELTGNVYYTGIPSSIQLNKTGTGNLVKLD